jgi:hypothetical protein
VIKRHQRIIYVRSAVPTEELLQQDQQLIEVLKANYRLVDERRFLKDEAAQLKRRLMPTQPAWRIEILRFSLGESLDPRLF